MRELSKRLKNIEIDGLNLKLLRLRKEDEIATEKAGKLIF
jgi:hypothetical protein